MKLLLYSDLHFSTYSSILRSRGEKYSTRLEGLIKTLNWIEEQAVEEECNCICCLGDFFDKPELTSEEITALSEVKFNNTIPHWMLVGNHEINAHNLSISSMHNFNLLKTFHVIDSIQKITFTNTDIYFLPYIFEQDRVPLHEIISKTGNKIIVLSHNDISGIQMGQFKSTEGYNVQDIDANCDLFINGHLHNGEKITKKIINIGNISGQNFSEDAFKYDHNIIILDTDTLAYKYIQNPYAFNFYKLDFTEENNIDLLNGISFKIKHNAVVSVKCKKDNTYECIRTRFDPNYNLYDPNDKVSIRFPKNCNVIESRFIVEYPKEAEGIDKKQIDFNTDHISLFTQFILQNIGDSDIIRDELKEVCS